MYAHQPHYSLCFLLDSRRLTRHACSMDRGSRCYPILQMPDTPLRYLGRAYLSTSLMTTQQMSCPQYLTSAVRADGLYFCCAMHRWTGQHGSNLSSAPDLLRAAIEGRFSPQSTIVYAFHQVHGSFLDLRNCHRRYHSDMTLGFLPTTKDQHAWTRAKVDQFFVHLCRVEDARPSNWRYRAVMA